METYTIKEALEITVEQLGAIAVPRKLNEQIGVPIDNAIACLRLCIEALNKEKENADKKDGNAEPDVEEPTE